MAREIFVNIIIFWDLMPFGLLDRHQHFRGSCYLHLQSKKEVEDSHPEQGGFMFLKKNWSLSTRTYVTSMKTITLILTTTRPSGLIDGKHVFIHEIPKVNRKVKILTFRYQKLYSWADTNTHQKNRNCGIKKDHSQAPKAAFTGP